MGLDMYLDGKKSIWSMTPDEKTLTEDGFPLVEKTLRLGYWRKHPNLHGYIVNTFAGGKDECQGIELDATQLENILKAVEDNRLPFTQGFFFGTSFPEYKESTKKILTNAIEWLNKKEHNTYKYVIYHASW